MALKIQHTTCDWRDAASRAIRLAALNTAMTGKTITAFVVEQEDLVVLYEETPPAAQVSFAAMTLFDATTGRLSPTQLTTLEAALKGRTLVQQTLIERVLLYTYTS